MISGDQIFEYRNVRLEITINTPKNGRQIWLSKFLFCAFSPRKIPQIVFVQHLILFTMDKFNSLHV